MKKSRLIKRAISIGLTIFLLILTIPFIVSAGTDASYPLYAGKTTEIGDVTVSDNGTQLTVHYQIDVAGWYLKTTHLYVGIYAPGKSAPGTFPYSHTGLGPQATSDEYVIPISDGSTYFIAAHADVYNSNNITGYVWPTPAEALSFLPVCGQFIWGDYSIRISYDSLLNGDHRAWCADLSHHIENYTSYSANFYYAGINTIPEYLTSGTDPNIDKPENLDLVNWVINHDSGFETVEVQRVIWCLLDENFPMYQMPELTPHELELYDAAFVSGENFTPNFAAGDAAGILAVPVNACGDETAIAQVLLTEYYPTCTPSYKSDTAWARGGSIFNTGWGSYFLYNT